MTPGRVDQAAQLLDARGLEPPEPMVRVLAVLALLVPRARICMLIEREPGPLYPILAERGFAFRTEARADMLYEVTIWHAHESGRVPAPTPPGHATCSEPCHSSWPPR
ncbi:MAG: DUF2249 domain-containing protein [Pseudomonadota bacterium]